MLNPSLTKEWEECISKLKETVTKCARCGIEYVPYNNVGMWSCKQHIVDSRFPMTFGNKWPCCGILYADTKRRSSLGCIRSDHSEIDVPYEIDSIAIFPKEIAFNMNIPSRSLRRDIQHPDGTVCIGRCDSNSHLERKNTSDNVIFRHMSMQ